MPTPEAVKPAKSLGELIAEYRVKAGLSVAEAAAKIGCTPDIWSMFESNSCGTGSGTPCALWSIATALGIKPSDFLK